MKQKTVYVFIYPSVVSHNSSKSPNLEESDFKKPIYMHKRSRKCLMLCVIHILEKCISLSLLKYYVTYLSILHIKLFLLNETMKVIQNYEFRNVLMPVVIFSFCNWISELLKYKNINFTVCNCSKTHFKLWDFILLHYVTKQFSTCMWGTYTSISAFDVICYNLYKMICGRWISVTVSNFIRIVCLEKYDWNEKGKNHFSQ